jgi:hypothetical protein
LSLSELLETIEKMIATIKKNKKEKQNEITKFFEAGSNKMYSARNRQITPL